MAEFEAREMTASDARSLWAMIQAETAEYVADFTPFASLDDLLSALKAAVADVYRSLFLDGALIGFFMLRGLDKGFARPAFGIYVSSSAVGLGVARFALDQAVALCKVRSVSALFLTVAETNLRALELYRKNGFREIGVHPETGQLMMERVLAS
jgi:ribosomal protein S18 acetylase RimI-like enzyme